MNPLVRKLLPVLILFLAFGVLNLLAHLATDVLAIPLRPSKYGFLVLGVRMVRRRWAYEPNHRPLR
jgi:hypothetical protein